MYYSTKEEKGAVTHFVASAARALAQAVCTCANRHCEIIATSFPSLSPFSISLNSPQCDPASHPIIITTQEKLKKKGGGGGRGRAVGNLRKTNKKARKRLAYEKDVTAEKNKLFFTICTLFAGNHTDKIIIIKVRGDWEQLHRVLATVFSYFKYYERDQQAPFGHARFPSPPFLSPTPYWRPAAVLQLFSTPVLTPVTGLRVTHTQAAESSRVSATKARDTPTRQHCSAMLGDKG